MNLSEVTNALAQQVKLETGIGNVSGFLPAKINPTHAFVERASLNYLLDASVDGVQGLLVLTIVVGQLGYDRGQEALDGYLSTEGAGSVFAAVQADKTLAGTCDYAVVQGATEVGALTINDATWIGARFAVEVVG